jgi:predicted ATPase
MMAHLRSVGLRSVPEDQADRFPFLVPIIRQLGTLNVDAPVTMLVSENGSGKSTLLEELAAAAHLPTMALRSALFTEPVHIRHENPIRTEMRRSIVSGRLIHLLQEA